MKRKTIRISITVMLMTTLFTYFTYSRAFAENGIPQPTEQFYVNDFADIFSDNQEQEMLAKAESLAEKPEGVQVVTSVVTSFEGISVEEYANNMYNNYAIGLESRGVLILLSTGDRQIRVEVGDGLSNYLTDAKAGEFIDNYAIDYLVNNQFDLGIMNLQAHIVSDLDKHFNIVSEDPSRQPNVDDDSEIQIAEENSTIEDKAGGVNVVVWCVNSLIFVGFVIMGIALHYRNKKLKEVKKIFENELEGKDLEINNLRTTINSRDVDISIVREHKNTYYHNLLRIQNQYDQLKVDYENLEHGIELLRKEIKILSERMQRAKRLYPNFDESIDQMIQDERDNANREMAKEFDRQFGDLERIVPSATTDVSALESAIRHYKSLNEGQKKYVKTNMDRIESIYAKAQELKAKEIAEAYNSKLKQECGAVSRGTEETLGRFQRLLNEYRFMDSKTRRFVDSALISSLDALISDGKREQEARIAEEKRLKRQKLARRLEEEEYQSEERHSSQKMRRSVEEEDYSRRVNHHSNSWSSGSSRRDDSGGFGGFGGYSSGGGASRGF